MVAVLAVPTPAAAQPSSSPALPDGAWCTGWPGRWVPEVAISPDGSTIAAAVEVENGLTDVVTVNAAGGTPALVGSGYLMWAGIAVADDGTVAVPVLSLDGTWTVSLLPPDGGPARAIVVPHGDVYHVTATDRGFMVVLGLAGEILLLDPVTGMLSVAWDAQTMGRDGVAFPDSADVDPSGRWAVILGSNLDTDGARVRAGDGTGVTRDRDDLIRGLRPALLDDGAGVVMTDTRFGTVRRYDLAGGPDTQLLPANVISLDAARDRFVWATWDWVENQVCVAPLPG